MDKESLIDEFEKYSISDLELIITDQKELYSNEELQIIEDIYNRKTSIKKKISDIDYAKTLLCIAALLNPFGGLVIGVIALITGSADWKGAGKQILLAAAISVLIRVFLNAGGFYV